MIIHVDLLTIFRFNTNFEQIMIVTNNKGINFNWFEDKPQQTQATWYHAPVIKLSRFDTGFI